MLKRKLLIIMILAFVLAGCSNVVGLEEALNPENYENVEVNTVLTMTSTNMDMTINSLVQVDGDNIYSYTTTEGMKISMYFLLEDEKYYSAAQSTIFGIRGDWEVEEIDEASELADLEDQQEIIPELSVEDFEKDEDGFYVLKEEKSSEYLDKVFKDAEEYMGGATFDDFHLKFKIEDKRISVIAFDLTFTVESQEVEITCEMKYSKFGEVSFDIPTAVTDLIK